MRQKYSGSEIYLVRNELDYWLFSDDGRRFSPDYLLFINDADGKRLYYQCIIEVKGGHLLDKDKWKEDALVRLAETSRVEFTIGEEDGIAVKQNRQAYQQYLESIKKSGYQTIENIGFKFYNTDPREEAEFSLEFEQKLFT